MWCVWKGVREILHRVKEAEVLLRAAHRLAGGNFRGALQQKEDWMSMLGFRSNNDVSKANKHVPQPPDPDVLMRQMDRSIAAVEYQRASIQLSKYPPPEFAPSKSSDNGKAMRAKDESVILAKGS